MASAMSSFHNLSLMLSVIMSVIGCRRVCSVPNFISTSLSHFSVVLCQCALCPITPYTFLHQSPCAPSSNPLPSCLPYPSLLGPLLPLSPSWSNSSLSTTVSLSQLSPAYNQVLVGLDFFHLILHVASTSKGQVMQQTLRSYI